MSSVTRDDEDPEMEQITLRLTRTLLEQIDDEWRNQGFPNRSEYMRHVLHDAVTTPEFDRDELFAIALGERELRRDSAAALTREEALEMANKDE